MIWFPLKGSFTITVSVFVLDWHYIHRKVLLQSENILNPSYICTRSLFWRNLSLQGSTFLAWTWWPSISVTLARWPHQSNEQTLNLLLMETALVITLRIESDVHIMLGFKKNSETFFFIIYGNISCTHLLEPSRKDGSDEGSQNIWWQKISKTFPKPVVIPLPQRVSTAALLHHHHSL